MDLPKILLTGLFFLFFFVFFGFPQVFGQLGLGQQKPREKPNKPKKPKKPILNGLTQDSSHRIGFFVFFCFFWFSSSFWTIGFGRVKKPREKPKKTKKNKFYMDLPKILLTGLVFFVFLFFFCFPQVFGCFWTVGLGTAKTSRKTK